MRRILIIALLLMGATAGHARAGRLIGYVDSFSAAIAYGWACNPSGGGPVSIVIRAGGQVLDVIPMTVARPDVAGLCPGGGAHGFGIRFDPATQAQFTGLTQLSLTASASGVPDFVLPPSSARAANPLKLPSGALQSVDAGGIVYGRLAPQAGLPLAELFAGGPPGAGIGAGQVAARLVDGQLVLVLPSPPVTLGADLAVFGAATDPFGAWVPLANPLVLIGGSEGWTAAASLPASASVQQSGSLSGITNTVFTNWMPAGVGFAGVSGAITLRGNDPTFSEALVGTGITADTETECLQRNGTTEAHLPAMRQLWAGILKLNGVGPVSAPVNVALPFAIGTGPGACIATVISAGYVNLDPTHARYTQTVADLAVTTMPPVVGAGTPLAVPIGGETRFPPSGTALSVYEGFRAVRAMHIAGVAMTASAAAITGAPPGSGWLPPPPGGWGLNSTLMYIPAAGCAAAGFSFQASNGYYETARMNTPIAAQPPGGSVTAVQVPIMGYGTQAMQRSAYFAFLPGGAFDGRLAEGDCLIAYETVFPDSNTSTGVLDVEAQSTVYGQVPE
jgi:hypothetical protein